MGRREELLELDRELDELERRRARNSFAVYAGLHIPAVVEEQDINALPRLTLPARYIPAAHHQIEIEALERLERGEITRLMILAPPGSAKSSYASVLFPPWYLGRNPSKNVIGACHTKELVEKFGRRARNVVDSEIHRSVFGAGLAGDQKASASWETEEGGTYFGVGVGGNVTGHRADVAVLDDLIRGREDADSKTIRDKTWEWYLADLLTRLKPGGRVVFITTRWHEDDPAGRILPENWNGKSGWVDGRDGERWYVLSFVAVIETTEDEDFDPIGRKMGEILWPEYFRKEELLRIKGRNYRNWLSLYQQKPKDEETAILKRAHWRLWKGDKPPECQYVMSVYDTAFEEDEEDDYSARTTWGIFWTEREAPKEPPPEPFKPGMFRRPPAPPGQWCAILLEYWKDRVEFPKLRKIAQEHYEKYKPDRVLVEKKASGHSLIQELRRAQVPVKALKADRSKLARAHAASVVLEQGAVWYLDKAWAHELINDCARATFIKGDPGNDGPDTAVYAWLHLRNLFWLELADEDDEPEEQRRENRLVGYGT